MSVEMRTSKVSEILESLRAGQFESVSVSSTSPSERVGNLVREVVEHRGLKFKHASNLLRLASNINEQRESLGRPRVPNEKMLTGLNNSSHNIIDLTNTVNTYISADR